MKKGIIITIITLLLVAIISTALATCINWNPDIFTGYTFQNDGFGVWKNTEVTNKYTVQELQNMTKDHVVYWIHEGDIDGIGIEIVEDKVLLVFNTNDKRLTCEMGPYRIWW